MIDDRTSHSVRGGYHQDCCVGSGQLTSRKNTTTGFNDSSKRSIAQKVYAFGLVRLSRAATFLPTHPDNGVRNARVMGTEPLLLIVEAESDRLGRCYVLLDANLLWSNEQKWSSYGGRAYTFAI